MPATSQAQQRYFGMVDSGKIPAPKGMTAKQVHDFAATKRKGLPKRAMSRKARRKAASAARSGM